MKRVLGYVAVALGGLIVAIVATVLLAGRFADGPIGPIAGGPFRSGELVTGPAAWPPIQDGRQVELQLVDPPQSRTTGSLIYEDKLYIPCDLGFIWRRLPSAGMRGIARVLWAVKHWHEDALRDGRAVLRIDGKRYQGQAVRVEDPALLGALRALMEERAAAYMHTTLTGAPADPEAIWFFRIDPR
jgi:hypothetical protein